tara:strand:+ start:96 stop:560 length:465 start_codon:yes stop_codon:yes gene_type:complete
MHWDVVISKQIEDYKIAASKVGLLNYNSLDEGELVKGLNSLVNERIKDSDWSAFTTSMVVHGNEDGSEIYAQELILIDKDIPHWSKSNKKIYKVVSASTLSSKGEKKGLIDIVNKEISAGWCLGKNSSFGYYFHNGKHCWHVRLFGPLFGGHKT